MLEIIVIRHGKTYGNTLGRYIGSGTDESLCEEGILQLQRQKYPQVSAVYSSPMKRCLETVQYIFDEIPVIINEELKECDFGRFENKNYKELTGDPNYQRWIDSNGTIPFPEGESLLEFQSRCARGFASCIEDAVEHGYERVAMVVHGGTIMSVLSQYMTPRGNYFQWQIKNGEYYHLLIDIDVWNKEKRISSVKKGL